MTHAQIAEVISGETGYNVSRSTVSAAIHRAGESKAAKIYTAEIPWVVHEKHQTHYAARMLRLLGRRNRGKENAPEMEARLDSWLHRLEEEGAVVTYVPDTEEGFFYVSGKPEVPGIPVRLTLDSLE